MKDSEFVTNQKVRISRMKAEAGAVLKQKRTNYAIEQTMAIHFMRIEEMERFLGWR